MYLKKLNIKYFRCFKNEEKDFEVEFAPRVTVLFGKNGSGKSSLIHAIHKALSFIFHKDRGNNKISNNLIVGFPELKVEKYERKDAVRNFKTGFLYPFISIKAEGSFLELPLSWEMYVPTSNKDWSPQKNGYSEALKNVLNKVEKTNELPFIAYYSDGFPHIPKDKELSREQYSLRNVGYLDWNQDSACSELWIERYKKTWKEWDRADRSINQAKSALHNCDVFLQKGMVNVEEYNEDVQLHKERLERAQIEKDKYDDEINQIKSCLIKFSKGNPFYEITDLFVSVYEEEGLCLETKQGRNPSFHKLPAGYKRLYYMVLDIAYRSYMLNKHTNPRGIVVIDEIDLHLHPQLEQMVLKRFMDAFPNLQFIVSTHSPLVLTGLETEDKPNRILRMNINEEKPTLWPDVYGLDYNTGLEDIMGVESVDAEFKYLLSTCAFLRNRKMYDEAEKIKKDLLKKFSKNETRLEELIVQTQKELE